MAVKDTLDKIVERHPDVIGAMVLQGEQVYHNLEEPYDVLAINEILETISEVFEQTEALADEGYDFSEMMLDFANHSFIVRSLDDGILAVLAPSLQRGLLVKLHVGLGIFGKAVQKALDDEKTSPPEIAVAPPIAEPAPPEADADAPVVQDDATSDQDESFFGQRFMKRRGGFRGTKQLLANRVQEKADAVEAVAATTEPQPKEPAVNADGIPLNPDGTPKKKRVYRGAVFWE